MLFILLRCWGGRSLLLCTQRECFTHLALSPALPKRRRVSPMPGIRPGGPGSRGCDTEPEACGERGRKVWRGTRLELGSGLERLLLKKHDGNDGQRTHGPHLRSQRWVKRPLISSLPHTLRGRDDNPHFGNEKLGMSQARVGSTHG